MSDLAFQATPPGGTTDHARLRNLAQGNPHPQYSTVGHVHDTAPWTAFTPTWTGSVTNPAIGNGTLVGAYRQVGKTLDFRIYCLAGSTTTFGSGNYSFLLPNSLAGIAREQVVACSVVDTGVTRYVAVGIIAASATTVQVQAGDSGTIWGATNPFTMGNGDFCSITGTIEVA